MKNKLLFKIALFMVFFINSFILSAQLAVKDSVFTYLVNKGDLIINEYTINDSLFRKYSFMVDTLVFCDTGSVAIYRFGAHSAHTTVGFMIVRNDSISVLNEPFIEQIPEMLRLFETCDVCFTRNIILNVLNVLIREQMMNDRIRAHTNWDLRIIPRNHPNNNDNAE